MAVQEVPAVTYGTIIRQALYRFESESTIPVEPEENKVLLAFEIHDKLRKSSSRYFSVHQDQWRRSLEKVELQGVAYNPFQLSTKDVYRILDLCNNLGTWEDTVHFKALELFNKYLLEVFKSPEAMKFNGKKRWQYLAEGVTTRFLAVHMAVCVQIASKLESDHKSRSVPTGEIHKVLTDIIKTACTREEIVAVEMHVLKTLDFRCSWITPIELIEQLLSLLKMELNVLKQVRQLCDWFLEYYYLGSEKIRNNFSVRMRRYHLAEKEISNSMVAAAIVDCALHIRSPNTTFQLRGLVAKSCGTGFEVYVLANVILSSFDQRDMFPLRKCLFNNLSCLIFLIKC